MAGLCPPRNPLGDLRWGTDERSLWAGLRAFQPFDPKNPDKAAGLPDRHGTPSGYALSVNQTCYLFTFESRVSFQASTSSNRYATVRPTLIRLHRCRCASFRTYFTDTR